MTVAEIMEQDLQTVEADTGNQAFTWLDQDGFPIGSYVCIPSNPEKEDVLIIGGEERKADLVLKVRQSLFAGFFPDTQHTITFAGEKYKIARVGKDATFNVMLRFVCVSNARMGH
jgi:hypothetical protein